MRIATKKSTHIKKLIIFMTACLAIHLCMPRLSYALRPYRITDSANPINRGNSIFEFGVSSSRKPDNRKIKKMMGELTFGLINNLDFEIEVPYHTLKDNKTTDEGIGDLTMKGKLTFLKGRQADMLSLAGMFIAKFPSCNEDKKLSVECTGEPDQGLKFIATRIFYPDGTTPLTVHLNLGRIFLGNPPGTRLKDLTIYSLAAETPAPLKNLTVLAEISGETNPTPGVKEDLQYLLMGITSRLSRRVTVNAGLSLGITKTSDDYDLSVGFSYRF